MRFAISTQDDNGLEGLVAPHFGRCPFYTLVDVENGEVQNVQVVPNPYFTHHSPGQVPNFIKEQQVDVMISGGMGRRAIALFEQFGIGVYTDASGTVQHAVELACNGGLQEAVPCAGHEGEHHHGTGQCA